MPTPTRHPHRLATVVPLTSSPARARRHHPSGGPAGDCRPGPGGDAVVIPFPIPTATARPGRTP